MIDFEKEFELANKLNSTLYISKKSNKDIQLPFNCGFNFDDNSFNNMYINNLIIECNNIDNSDNQVHLLEKIIGKETLYQLFKNGNTQGFIDELKNYLNEEEIYNYIDLLNKNILFYEEMDKITEYNRSLIEKTKHR